MNDPTTGGLPINADPPEKDRDVFAYLQRLYLEAHPSNVVEDDGVLAEFIELARKTFSDNQPVGMDYLGTSLGLRFQDGMVLTFCDVEAGMDGVGGVSGGIDMARQHEVRGGKGQTVRTPSFGVTGNEDRQK